MITWLLIGLVAYAAYVIFIGIKRKRYGPKGTIQDLFDKLRQP